MLGLLISTCAAALHPRSYIRFHKVKVNKVIGEGKLKDFNLGYLMRLPLTGLKCICGKPLGHTKDDAICAACGLVVISLKRHLALLRATKNGRIREIAPTI
jgi:hypothetical protein